MTESYCASCGNRLEGSALVCGHCHQFVHAAQLEELSKRAAAAEASDPEGALKLWREAIALLPPESKQAESVRGRIAALEAKARGPKQERPAWIKAMGPFATLGVLAWKFKTVLLIALTKGKFLLLGFGKVNTLFTMLASIGLYWSLYGWQFAVGFIGGIYVHEMGHVWALRQLGLRASAPMFIPGLGALVSLYDSPANVRDDARIGLAGPIWGAAAGVAFWIIGYVSGSGLWLAVARSTAIINLFNLTPVWQLDGGRGFRALDFQQRLGIGVLMLLLWMVTGEGMLLILVLGAGWRIFGQKDHAPAPGDQTTLLHFAGLLALFAAMMRLIPIR